MNRIDPHRRVLPVGQGAPATRAVFLARDGVLNEGGANVSRPQDFHWLPGALAALRALADARWRLVVVSNQPGIALGLFGPAEYDNLTRWMQADLASRGIGLDGIYHCPHLPDAPLAAWCRRCDCHLPSPGLLRRAARDLRLDLPASVMIGDKPADIDAGRRAGVAACVRIADGLDLASCDIANPPADFTCASLAEAAQWLLEHERRLHA